MLKKKINLFFINVTAGIFILISFGILGYLEYTNSTIRDIFKEKDREYFLNENEKEIKVKFFDGEKLLVEGEKTKEFENLDIFLGIKEPKVFFIKKSDSILIICLEKRLFKKIDGNSLVELYKKKAGRYPNFFDKNNFFKELTNALEKLLSEKSNDLLNSIILFYDEDTGECLIRHQKDTQYSLGGGIEKFFDIVLDSN